MGYEALVDGALQGDDRLRNGAAGKAACWQFQRAADLKLTIRLHADVEVAAPPATLSVDLSRCTASFDLGDRRENVADKNPASSVPPP